MCNGFEAGSYLRLTDRVYHSALGLRVIKKKKKKKFGPPNPASRAFRCGDWDMQVSQSRRVWVSESDGALGCLIQLELLGV